MAELTEQQINDAVDAFGAEWDQQKGLGANRIICERRGLSAAAPFLQLPWDEPTVEEYDIAVRDVRIGNTANGVDIARSIVRRRNAALQPKPVDPRRDAIRRVVEALRKTGDVCSVEDAVDVFIKVLDLAAKRRKW
jgi:hypothetical protein